MNERQKVSLAILVLIILFGVLWMMRDLPVANPYDDQTDLSQTSTATHVGEDSMTTYVNVADHFSFEYPSSLYLKQRSVSRGEEPKLSIVLVRNTDENVDFVEGRTQDVREGPTAVTFEVYDNPTNLSPEAWAEQDKNWGIHASSVSVVAVDGVNGSSYAWSGLYEGRSVILPQGEDMIVLSVTWMSPEDQILKDFETILDSAAFTD